MINFNFDMFLNLLIIDTARTKGASVPRGGSFSYIEAFEQDPRHRPMTSLTKEARVDMEKLVHQ